MKIVLLGGTGFIGEYLAKNLSSTKSKVVVIGRETSLENTGKNAKVLVIMTQPSSTIMEDVAAFVKSAKSLKKIMYLSSLLLYPSSTKQNTEDVTLKPLTVYEKSKYLEEELLSKVTKDTGCQLCIVRLTNVYGDVKNKGLINNIFLSLFNEKKLIIQGDLILKIRDYIFIEDAVNLLTFLIFYNQQKQKEIFNICTNTEISISELIEKIELVTKEKINFSLGGSILEKKTISASNKKILDVSKYQLKYNLVRGLKKTYQNYLKFLI